MCSRVLSPALVALLALVLGVPGAGAQMPEAEQVRASLDSLIPLVERARARARVADSLARVEKRRRNAIDTETIRVGPLNVVAAAGQADEARAVMESVWREFEPFAGGEARDLFRDQTFTFQTYHTRGGNIFVEAPETRIQRVEIRSYLGRERLREKAASAVADVLNEGLDDELRRWGGLTAAPAVRDGGWLYRRVVTAPSRAVRACYRGDLDICWEAVGAVEAEGDRWARLYTPLERVALARRASRPWDRNSEEHAAWEECLADRVEEACSRFLRLRDGGQRIPLSPGARSSLLMVALEEGGEGAYGRLVRTDGSIKERLVAASGMDPDELMSRWLERIRSARPDHEEGAPATRWSTLVWILALGFLATRSTRWRLG